MSNNDLWCSKCRAQHHPSESCEEQVSDKTSKQSDGVREKIVKSILETFLPFADHEFRKEFPHDGWEWNHNNIEKLTSMASDQILSIIEAEKKAIIESVCEPCQCRLTHPKGCQCWNDD